MNIFENDWKKMNILKPVSKKNDAKKRWIFWNWFQKKWLEKDEYFQKWSEKEEYFETGLKIKGWKKMNIRFQKNG